MKMVNFLVLFGTEQAMGKPGLTGTKGKLNMSLNMSIYGSTHKIGCIELFRAQHIYFCN